MLIARMNRTLRRDEAGQALVLGVLVMLVLALSVMATVQLGHGVSERIRAQDAADNVAFSSAAAVARSLNFISWVNRTIAAQYVAAMAVQGLLAFVDGFDAWLGMLADLVQSLASLACILKRAAQICCAVCLYGSAIACPLAEFLDILQSVLEEGASVLQELEQAMRKVSDAIDKPIALFVMAVVYLNRYAMYGAQLAMKWSMAAIFGSGAVAKNFARRLMEATAGPNLNTGGFGLAYNATMAGYNGYNYLDLFDDQSDKIPDGGTGNSSYSASDGKQRAERLMAAITNASRTGIDQEPNYPIQWETNGGLAPGELVEGVAGRIINAISGHVKVASRLTMPMVASAFTEEEDSGADLQNLADSAAAGRDKCQKSGKEAQAKKTDCQNKRKQQAADEKVCGQDEQKCAADQTACANSGHSGSAACAKADASCKTRDTSCGRAADSRSAADASCSEAESAQKAAEKSCDDAKAAAQEMQSASATRDSGKQNYIWTTGKDVAVMTRGTALVSAAHVEMALDFVGKLSGGGDPKIVGVQAAHDQNRRLHCHYNGRRNVTVPSCPKYAWTKAIKCEKDSNHDFWGMTRYVSFKIAEDYPFGATDYIGLVNKPAKEARFPIKNLGFGGDKMTIGGWAQSGGKNAIFQGGSVGANTPVFSGVNGWARAQAYYHRPGAWAEPPNMFNPFWKARLAPIRGPLFGKFMQSLPDGEAKKAVEEMVLH
jgi:hypothetical protein